MSAPFEAIGNDPSRESSVLPPLNPRLFEFITLTFRALGRNHTVSKQLEAIAKSVRVSCAWQLCVCVWKCGIASRTIVGPANMSEHVSFIAFCHV